MAAQHSLASQVHINTSEACGLPRESWRSSWPKQNCPFSAPPPRPSKPSCPLPQVPVAAPSRGQAAHVQSAEKYLVLWETRSLLCATLNLGVSEGWRFPQHLLLCASRRWMPGCSGVEPMQDAIQPKEGTGRNGEGIEVTLSFLPIKDSKSYRRYKIKKEESIDPRSSIELKYM